MSSKSVSDFVIVENSPLNDTNYLIRLKAKNELPQFMPGQFVNVEIKGTDEIFLRRPFSVFEVDYDNNTLSLLVKILGRGSKKLTESREGETCSIIYPLGRSFTLPAQDEKVLLVGGGSGVAPMLFLAKESGLSPDQVHLLLGARTAGDHIDVSDYKSYGKVYYSTEDGALGEKGFVTQHSIFSDLTQFDRIYACGPDGMMKAIAREARARDVECEVSLENLMACGFGVCLCCIEPTTKGNQCVCTAGPVFNVKDLKW